MSMNQSNEWTEGFPDKPGYYWFCTFDFRLGAGPAVRFGKASVIGGGSLLYSADGAFFFPQEFEFEHRVFFYMPCEDPPAPPDVEPPKQEDWSK